MPASSVDVDLNALSSAEIAQLQAQAADLTDSNKQLEEKLSFQLSMVSSLSQEVIEANLEITDQVCTSHTPDQKNSTLHLWATTPMQLSHSVLRLRDIRSKLRNFQKK